MNTHPACIAGLLASLLVVGCGTARRGALLTGPHVPPTAEIERGERVFGTYCHGCHPGGEQGVGIALNNKPLPGWAIRFQVRHGLGAMPAFSDEVISGDDLDDLVAYLVWLRRLDPRTPAVPPE